MKTGCMVAVLLAWAPIASAQTPVAPPPPPLPAVNRNEGGQAGAGQAAPGDRVVSGRTPSDRCA